MNFLQQYATGVMLRFVVTESPDNAIVDLSGVTTKNLIIRRPDQTVLVKEDIPFGTSGADGVVYYVTEADDLDVVGEYRLQLDLAFPAGYAGTSEVLTDGLMVEGNLE